MTNHSIIEVPIIYNGMKVYPDSNITNGYIISLGDANNAYVSYENYAKMAKSLQVKEQFNKDLESILND